MPATDEGTAVIRQHAARLLAFISENVKPDKHGIPVMVRRRERLAPALSMTIRELRRAEQSLTQTKTITVTQLLPQRHADVEHGPSILYGLRPGKEGPVWIGERRGS